MKRVFLRWVGWVGFALLFASSPAAAEGYFKCETANGIEYADAPCEDGASRRGFPDQYEREQRRVEQRRFAACFRPSRVLSPGDAASDLAELCGQPRKVRRLTTADGVEERWEYRQGQGVLFVFVEKGAITAIRD